AAALAVYGLKIYGESYKNDAPEPKPPGGSIGSSTVVSQPASAPLWVRLVRSGDTITSYRSPDGSTWTAQGTNTVTMAPVVYVGLAVTSGNYNQLNTSTFDNVTVTGVPAAIQPPVAEWKLDETSGTIAYDSIDSFDGLCYNVVLGQPGATPVSGYSAGFNGATSTISTPALNLNSNVLTITGWVNRNGNQSAWSGIFFNRANTTVAGLHFGTANELRYTWNNNAGTYNWNSGLTTPNNQWAFVALVIEPTRARLFLATNGLLFAATNNMANSAQAFDGASYLGQDSLGGRFFNGLLDDVRFFNQALTPAQLSQIASTPAVAFTTPVNGQEFLPPATVNLSASLSATNGHTINLVQLFNGADLISESAAPPYTNTVSGLPAGSYTFSARLYYDSGLAVDSDPANVIVETGPAPPQNVLVSALSSSQAYVSWQPSAGADGYILNRNGSPVATFGTTTNYFVDTGLMASTSYCYTVTATNQVGSAASASSCVNTPAATATTLTWDAGSSGGPQDGNGTWNTTTTNWWNGSADVAWTDNNLVVFGAGGATNSLVSLAATVAPRGFIFNASAGGTYTISNVSGGITLAGTNVVFANADATINAVLSGPGKLVKAGNNTLTLPAANSQTGGVTVNAGMIVASAPNGSAYGSTGNGNLLVNFGGIIEANGDNSLVGQTTSGSKTITINAGGMVTNTGTSSCHLNAVVLNGGTLAATSANGTYANWNFDHGVSTPGGGQVSIIAGGNATVSQTSGTVFNIGANDTVTVSTVLDHVSGISDTGLIKSGTGTLILSAVNNYTLATTVSAGTLQVDGSVAAGVTVQITATLAGSGTVHGGTTAQSGGTLAPGDAGIGTLSFGGNLTLNPGAKTVLEVGKFFGALNNDLILAAGALTLNGSLTVINIGADALAAGDSFDLLDAGSFSGNFTSVTLPALPSGLVWDSSQLARTGVITVVSVTPVISGVGVSGSGGLAVGGSGAAGQGYVLLATSSLAPTIVWLPVQTNIADTNGIFSLTDLQATNFSQRFYRVMAQ
ncbi:MAG TPA: LamG-like jellyroll fold domain-containing protein, partial [Verrucomicrobiae bacterium]|nr:LamG-like jellyroll fold domain-containing protein [Verrucomicrobiae bacterium]